MGARGNIVIVQHGYGVEEEDRYLYLYTHWRGYETSGIVRSALKAAPDRWDDEQYLAKVIFCEMVKGDIEGTTGYGITTYLTDYNHPSVVVDTEKQIVWIANPTEPSIPLEKWTFKEFTDTV